MLNSNPVTTIPPATWPESLPHPEETEFLSVVAHSDCIRWSLHVRHENGFRAQFWWKSEGFNLLENSKEEISLSDLMPLLKEISGNLTGTNAMQQWAYVKRIPTWTIYVLTADPTLDVAPLLHHVFCDIPCRFYSLQPSDFFPSHEQPEQIHSLPIYLASSLKYVLSISRDDAESILLFDTKRTRLEYVVCRGAKIIGQGTGPSLQLFNKNPAYRFNFTSESAKNISAYLEIKGIVKEWEERSQGCKQRKIWMDGIPADTNLLSSFLGKSNNKTTTIIAVPDLVHFGIDAVLKEQTEIHGELHEPLDLLLLGQRVKIANPALFGTIRNAIPRETNASLLEFEYNVELDDGKRQQVLGMNQVMASIVLYIQHKEQELSIREPNDDYTIMLARKVETAQAAIALYEKERKRLELSQPSVAAPNNDMQNLALGDHGGEVMDRRQAAEDADPEAPRKRSYVGRGIAKYFDKKLFTGVITGWDPAAIVDDNVDLWKVEYEDGDAEDFEEEELFMCLDRYVQARERQRG